MNPLNANFDELYRRHLCRHSEFGINVLHLIAVVGVYLALFGIALALPGGAWIFMAVLTAYFATLAINLPILVWVVTIATVFLMLGTFLYLPQVPIWAYVIMLIFWHKFQNWNHKIYHKEHAMDEFQDKYRKGLPLFFLLSVYELPVLLNYLVFDRNRLSMSSAQNSTSQS